MEDGIFEKIKSNNKEMKKIKVKMAILKYFQIIIGISAGTAFLQNAANWFSFGFIGGLILTSAGLAPYGLIEYIIYRKRKTNRIKRESLEKENEELNNSYDYSNDNEKENIKEKTKEEVKKETVIKEENKSKEENVSKKESETENKEKNVNEEKKLEKPTISEQRISLEELRNQIMNLEIEQGYDEDKKYVKAK